MGNRTASVAAAIAIAGCVASSPEAGAPDSVRQVRLTAEVFKLLGRCIVEQWKCFGATAQSLEGHDAPEQDAIVRRSKPNRLRNFIPGINRHPQSNCAVGELRSRAGIAWIEKESRAGKIMRALKVHASFTFVADAA